VNAMCNQLDFPRCASSAVLVGQLLSLVIWSQAARASGSAGDMVMWASSEKHRSKSWGTTGTSVEPADQQERHGDDRDDTPVFEPAVSLGAEYRSNPYLGYKYENWGVAITLDMVLYGEKLGLDMVAVHHLHRYVNQEIDAGLERAGVPQPKSPSELNQRGSKWGILDDVRTFWVVGEGVDEVDMRVCAGFLEAGAACE